MKQGGDLVKTARTFYWTTVHKMFWRGCEEAQSLPLTLQSLTGRLHQTANKQRRLAAVAGPRHAPPWNIGIKGINAPQAQ